MGTLEKLNQESKYQIELYKSQISSQQERIQQQEAKCKSLRQQLEQTRAELERLKQEFNCSIEDKVTQHKFELEILEDFSRKIGYTFSYEELFHSMLEHLSELVPCDVRGGIITQDKNCNIYLESNRSLSKNLIAEIKEKLVNSLTKINGWDLSQDSISLHQIDQKKVISKEDEITEIGSHFLVPIIADPEEKKQIIGLLFIGDEKKECFSEDSIRLLYAIADRASISVQQLRVLLAAESSRLENEKIRANLEKERALNNLKLRFVRTISHEYRTPLTVISLASDLLEKQKNRLSEAQRIKCWQRIHSAIQHMFNLVEDVLLLDSVETGEMELNQEQIDLVSFCKELVEDFQLLATRNQTIEFNYSGINVEVYADLKLLQQIISNLLSNALKYSPEQSKIIFQLTFTETGVTFCIQDEGIGIPVEDIPRLFEPFHRADNVGNAPGTGLGLAIVKKSVELQQGEISVESQLGIGSTFTAKLPLKKVERD